MKHISFRRYWLDKFLAETDFTGKVLDVGGAKVNKRGCFRPDLDKVQSWEYLNIDEKTCPDFLCSSENIPVQNSSYDVVLITEVLEHLEYPEQTLKEAFRVLKDGGKLILSMPFLYPVHAHPFDYQRWTPEKIKLELTKIGFAGIQIKAMGGFFAVLYDLSCAFLNDDNCRFSLGRRIIRKFIMPAFIYIYRVFDKWLEPANQKITTGFYVLAVK